MPTVDVRGRAVPERRVRPGKRAQRADRVDRPRSVGLAREFRVVTRRSGHPVTARPPTARPVGVIWREPDRPPLLADLAGPSADLAGPDGRHALARRLTSGRKGQYRM